MGVKIVSQVSFYGREVYFTHQVKEIIHIKSDGVIIHASPFDTVNIVHQLSEKGFRNPIYAANAPYPQVDASYFKYAVQLQFPSSFWVSKEIPKTIEIQKKFRGLIKGKVIYPSAIQTYDTISVIKTILEKEGFNPNEIDKNREIIMKGWANLKKFPAFSGTFSTSINGDAKREVYLITPKADKYMLLK